MRTKYLNRELNSSVSNFSLVPKTKPVMKRFYNPCKIEGHVFKKFNKLVLKCKRCGAMKPR